MGWARQGSKPLGLSRSGFGPLVLRPLFGFMLGLGLIACGGTSENEPSTQLVVAPAPSLDGFEPAVRQQLRQRREAAVQAGVGAGAKALSWGELGQAYHAYDLLEAAAPAYSNAAMLAPNDPRWPYYRGVLLQTTGDPQAAAAAFGEALALTDGAASAAVVATRLRRGDALLDAGQPTAALEAFAEASPASPGITARTGSSAVAYAFYGQGRGLLALDQPDAAVAVLRRALELAPEAGRVRWSLGQAYLRLGERQRAGPLLDGAGPRPPAFEDPWMEAVAAQAVGSGAALRRGSLALLAGDVATAVEQLQAAVAANPDSQPARQSLGSALARQGRFEEARQQLEKAVELAPGSRDALLLLAAVEEHLGDDLAAEATLDRAATVAPGDPEVELRRAQRALAGGRPAAAAAAFAALVEADPENVTARLGEAAALQQARREADAARRLDEGLTRFSKNADIAHALARLLVTAEEPSVRDGARGLELARVALEDNPTLERGQTLALAHAAVGQWAEALTWQERVAGELERRAASGDGAAAAALPEARERRETWRREAGL